MGYARAWVFALISAPEDCLPWLEIFRFDQVEDAKRLAQAGVSPAKFDKVVKDGKSVRWMLRQGEPVDYIVRLLKDNDLL